MSAAPSTHLVQSGAPPERSLRVLIISNLFPPSVMGGAELAAYSLAAWLARNGSAVQVLTGSPTPDGVGIDLESAEFTIERRFFPNIYPIYKASEKRPSRKLRWHLRDHFNESSEAIVQRTIETFQPDIVNTHDLQGISYNLLREIARQRLPCVQTLHDFGFLCLNMKMFSGGKPCARQHLPCAISGMVKRKYLSNIQTLAFWSPSQALLDRHLPHLPRHTEAVCIKLPLLFSPPPGRMETRSISAPLQLLYVGQITEAKGVSFLLNMLEPLAAKGEVEIVVVGSGSLLDQLKGRYQGAAWVKFTGRVPPEEVGGFMARSDLLMIPSLWFENSPLVAYQANQLGLPILASRIGGLPELIREGVNGRLLPPGDAAQWQACLRDFLFEPEALKSLRTSAREGAANYDPDLLGAAVVRLFRRTISAASTRQEAVAV